GKLPRARLPCPRPAALCHLPGPVGAGRPGRGAGPLRRRRAPGRAARHRALRRHGRRHPRTGDPCGDPVLPAAPRTDARRHRRTRHPPGARPSRPTAHRLPGGGRPRARLGRRRPPVPARVARLSVRSHRRGLRRPHRGRAAPLSGMGGAGARRRRRPRDLAGAAPPGAALSPLLRAPELRRDRRSLRPARGPLPLRRRLHRRLERARAGRRARMRGRRHAHLRPLRPARGHPSPSRHDVVVRPPQPHRRAAGAVRHRRPPDRPGRLLGTVERPAPALRAARPRRRGQPAQRVV
ncbi:MAG: Phage minor structural protein, partial [uncultured Solirubrobacteraceae bacterium]